MKVAIGSQNPTKIQATQIAFAKIFPKRTFTFEPVIVASGISAQPMSDKEAIRGATNRAKRALRKAKADYGIGLEGGLQKIGKRYFECGWIVVIDSQGHTGIGSSVRIPVPEKLMQEIFAGTELGYATDKVFKLKQSKEKMGFFGIMTNGQISRASGYADGVVAALSAFIHPDLL